jgi:hypothetical protein
MRCFIIYALHEILLGWYKEEDEMGGICSTYRENEKCIGTQNFSPKITNFVELSASWDAANCAATQELPNILWNPRVYNRVQKSLSLARSIQSIPPHLLSEIHFIIVHPPTSWFS